MTNLQQVLKATRTGSEPRTDALVAKLIAELQQCPAYKNSIGKPGARLVARMCTIAGFRRKYLCICFDGTFVPITANKLYAKTRKAKCKHCGKEHCHRGKNLSALRNAVAPQIMAFREQHAKQVAECDVSTPKGLRKLLDLTTCPLSGKRLTNCETHVDHSVPFSKLVAEWASSSDAKLCEQKLWLKHNSAVLAEWAKFHEAKAELQLVSAKANLSKGAKSCAYIAHPC